MYQPAAAINHADRLIPGQLQVVLPVSSVFLGWWAGLDLPGFGAAGWTAWQKSLQGTLQTWNNSKRRCTSAAGLMFCRSFPVQMTPLGPLVHVSRSPPPPPPCVAPLPLTQLGSNPS